MFSNKLGLRKEISDIKYWIQSKSITNMQILQLKEFEWCIFLIRGPQDSPYENFWFRLRCQWPQKYPYYPPKCAFIDKIWNPFVDEETNKICLDRLDDNWTSALRTRTVILSIISLLSDTKISENKDGFANPQAAIQMMKNYPYFCEHAKKISKVSCYRRQNIISNQIKGILEQHIVEVESNQLPKLIAKSLKSKKYNKRNPINIEKQLTAFAENIELSIKKTLGFYIHSVLQIWK